MSWTFVLSHINYVAIIFLMMTGLLVVYGAGNLIKKLAGITIFQTSVFMLYITVAKVVAPEGFVHSGPPILPEDDSGHALPPGDLVFSNPLPHVLILTAIVVGVSTLALGVALCVRIRDAYGTIEEDAIRVVDAEILANGDIDAQPAGGKA